MTHDATNSTNWQPKALNTCQANNEIVALVECSLKKKKEAVSALITASEESGGNAGVVVWHGGHQAILFTNWKNTGVSAKTLARRLTDHVRPRRITYEADIHLGKVDEHQCALIRGDLPKSKRTTACYDK